MSSEIDEGQSRVMVPGFEKASTMMKDSMESTTKVFGATQAKTKETMAKSMKTMEDMVAFSKGNLDAFISAGQIFSTGMQDLSKQIAASTQDSVENAMTMTKKLAGMKSVKEFIEFQSGYAHTMSEKVIADTSKILDLSLKVTERAVAPITERVTFAVEKFRGVSEL